MQRETIRDPSGGAAGSRAPRPVLTNTYPLSAVPVSLPATDPELLGEGGQRPRRHWGARHCAHVLWLVLMHFQGRELGCREPGVTGRGDRVRGPLEGSGMQAQREEGQQGQLPWGPRQGQEAQVASAPPRPLSEPRTLSSASPAASGSSGWHSHGSFPAATLRSQVGDPD